MRVTMKEQLELFPIEPDDRNKNLTSFLKCQLAVYPLWHPTAKQILELSDRYGVTGRKPLELYDKIIEEKFNGRDERPL